MKILNNNQKKHRTNSLMVNFGATQHPARPKRGPKFQKAKRKKK
jgi:hypothetical protein